MRAGVKIFALWCLLAPAVFPATDKSPHELFDALNALRLDPSAIYRIPLNSRIELRRGDAVLSFEEGTLAFLLPFEGRVTGVVFSGRGHILAVPRDPSEKQQMGYFLGAPVLDQDFVTAYIRFTDDTADELLHQFQVANLEPQMDASFILEWEPALAQPNPRQTLRILLDWLSPNRQAYFYSALEGVATGAFDLVLDAHRDEQFLLGQSHKAAGKSYYDVWTSHSLPGSVTHPVPFRALRYAMDTTIRPDNSLDATASVHLRAETGAERVLAFQLARDLVVDKVTDEQGAALAFFQNEGMTFQQRSVRGEDFIQVILPEPAARNQELTLHFHYRGNVIENAGNGVLFVGARESWYPHLGDAAAFADYDLTMRWPHKLRLVATGSKLEEHEEGDFRVGHWKTERPAPVAGFNLGDYAAASFSSEGHSIDVYANRELEESLRTRLSMNDGSSLAIASNSHGIASTGHPIPPMLSPSPADALRQLGKEMDSSIHFYESFSGPFPFHTLSVSQIPGSFAQGWPGLLYLSTFSFLSADAQRRAGLNTKGQEQFNDLVPYHEVAHQWWGNVVAWSSYRDQWIDEAIANYLALLFADSQKIPDHTLRLWLTRFREQLVEKSSGNAAPASEIGALTLGTRLDSSKSPNGYETVIYSKGAWIFHMLHEMLRRPGDRNPDARFSALLRAIATKYAYRAFSTEDLQHEVEAVMTPGMDLEGGRSMDWFFAEWVRGDGIPHYRVEFTVRPSEKGFVIRGKLFQKGVPRSFIASVPLYASGGAVRNAFLGAVVAVGPETSFQFLMPTHPSKIIIDPQMTLLCITE
jgi:hypothetical protein